jgi:nicotinamidase-related amidase
MTASVGVVVLNWNEQDYTAECVRSLLQMNYPSFNVIVVEDATATFFEHHHRAALSGFARVFGQVWDTEHVLSALATP